VSCSLNVTPTLSRSPRVEAGSNTSTVALQVVGDDEIEPGAWGYNWAMLFIGDINTGTYPSKLGSLESEINPVHTTLSYISKIHFNIILSLGLPSGLFPSGFPNNILYALLMVMLNKLQCPTGGK
jgi:hypothetical protein